MLETLVEALHSRESSSSFWGCVLSLLEIWELEMRSSLGSILRHMPLLGAVQVLFLANSDHKRSSPYPVYTRAFLKEVMRVSMARNYKADRSFLCFVSERSIIKYQ